MLKTRIYSLLAKIGADTAENERHFAENFLKTGSYPTGPSKPAGPRELQRVARGADADPRLAPEVPRLLSWLVSPDSAGHLLSYLLPTKDTIE